MFQSHGVCKERKLARWCNFLMAKWIQWLHKKGVVHLRGGGERKKGPREMQPSPKNTDQRPWLSLRLLHSRPALLINPTETPARSRRCQGMNYFHKVLCHATRLTEIFPNSATSAIAPSLRSPVLMRESETGNVICRGISAKPQSQMQNSWLSQLWLFCRPDGRSGHFKSLSGVVCCVFFYVGAHNNQ